MWNPFRKKESGGSGGSKNASDGLRGQALSLNAKQAGVLPTNVLPHVWAVLMEEGLGGNTGFCLLCMGEGTTSLYLFPGGGIVGAGQHKAVREASDAFLAVMQTTLDKIPEASPAERPKSGEVRFSLRTFDGADRSVVFKAADVRRPNHPFFKYYIGGQNVITAIREASQGRM